MVDVAHCKTEQTYNKDMNDIYEHRNIHWRKLDSLLRLTALYDWQKYEVKQAPRNPRCFIIKVGSYLKIYLYNEISHWELKWHHDMCPRIIENNRYHTIDEGYRSGKSSKSVTMFLWSLISNFVSRKSEELNEHEQKLYNQLTNMFYLRNEEYEYIISDWKENARS